VKKGVYFFDHLKHACLMTTNTLDATKMLLGFDRFFCFDELHFAINPRAGLILVVFKNRNISILR